MKHLFRVYYVHTVSGKLFDEVVYVMAKSVDKAIRKLEKAYNVIEIRSIQKEKLFRE